MAQIDNYATPTNPVVDVTAKPLQVYLTFARAPSETPATETLQASGFEGFLNLSADENDFLVTPLGQTFDKVWSQDQDSSGQTIVDQVKAQLTQGITTLGAAMNHAADNIIVDVPQTGILRAIVIEGTTIYLSYEVSGIAGYWDADNTGLLFIPNASFKVTLDLELFIQIILPGFPSPVTPSIFVNLYNTSINATNSVASVEEAVVTLENFFEEQPLNIWQAAEGAFDSAGGSVATDTSSLSSLFSSISTIWQGAWAYGFTQLTAQVKDNQLSLDFVHPLNPPVVVTNGVVSTTAKISTDPEVSAGSTITVTGTNFPLDQANALYITWQDTTFGSVQESDVTIQPLDVLGAPPTLVKIIRTGPTAGTNYYPALGLQPNSAYEFRVTDLDLITQTPPSAPLLLETTSLSAIVVEFYLVLGGQQVNVGNTNLSTTGSISAPITIPVGQIPGTYTLAAMLAGTQIASTPLVVVGPGGVVPVILVQGTTTSPAWLPVGDPFPLIFEGFQPGTISVYLNSATGALLGTATSTGIAAFSASFTYPYGAEGPNNLYAQNSIASQPPATCAVYGFTTPS
jgi:hypothetical protein